MFPTNINKLNVKKLAENYKKFVAGNSFPPLIPAQFPDLQTVLTSSVFCLHWWQVVPLCEYTLSDTLYDTLASMFSVTSEGSKISWLGFVPHWCVLVEATLLRRLWLPPSSSSSSLYSSLSEYSSHSLLLPPSTMGELRPESPPLLASEEPVELRLDLKW
jgi:hypothetical protein